MFNVQCSCFLLALATTLHATDFPTGGTDLAGSAALQASIRAGSGNTTALAEGGQSITVAADKQSLSHIAQFTQRCAAADFDKDQRLLAIIRARVVGSDKGIVTAKLQLRTAPYTALAESTDIDIYRDWRDYPVLFTANDSAAADASAIVLLCGQQPQTLEIASIRVQRFPSSTAVADFPRILRSYVGREPDAPWRVAALERIERERKADLALPITDAQGKPLANTAIHLVQRRHQFGFGTAIPMQRLIEDSPDAQRMRDTIDRYFSTVVFENDLKDGNWGRDVKPQRSEQIRADMDKAFAWLAARHIPVRGHYLMQVPIPVNLAKAPSMAVIRDHFIYATQQRLAFVRDRVSEWDVINHPIAWSSADMLSTRPGYNQLDREIFTLARSLTTLPLCVNEDQIFRPGPQHDDTFSYIKALNDSGHTVAALGNQAHFHESYLPSPQHLLDVTDHFASIVPRQLITEFDVVTTNDDTLAADYTRDALIACFSHPAYDTFLWWGFWEGSHWKPEAALWSKDWTPRPTAKVVEEWLGKRWRTDTTITTDAKGIAHWRGFPGWYQIGNDKALVQALPQAKK